MAKKTNDLPIDFSTRFEKQLRECTREVQIAFQDALDIFLENPTDSTLRDHQLERKLAEYRSINVTRDYRALYKKKTEGKRKIIKFYMIGTHYQLYRNAPK